MLAINYHTATDAWVIDSGVSHQMCNNRNLFIPDMITKTNFSIQLGNKTTVKATEEGLVPFRGFKVKALGKFAERAQPCMLLGYVHKTTKIYRIWDFTGRGRALESSNIKFIEERNAWNATERDQEHGDETCYGPLALYTFPTPFPFPTSTYLTPLKPLPYHVHVPLFKSPYLTLIT